jgi:hypothetical protein
MSVRFVLCVEAGRLEGEAVLLCESIRRFAGSYADSPISAYRPREGEHLATETHAALAELGAEVIEEPLNREHAYYPLANKVHCAAHAEANAGEDVLVLLDSDTVLLGEPAAFALGDEIDAAVSPVGRVGDGSTGPGHDNEPYWERLYELAGARGRPFTRTALRGKRIRGYWNTGVVALRRDAGLAGAWLDLMTLLIRERHLPERGIDHVEQLSLAATLAREPDRVATLPPNYNYRITRREKLAGDAPSLDLPDLVHVHYMRSFYVRGFLEALDPPLDRNSEQFGWLAERLPLEPAIELSLDAGRPIRWQDIRAAASGQLGRKPFELPPES